MVEEFAARRSDHALHERMGHRHMRHSLDFVDAQNPQVGRPPVRLEQRIVIRAEMSRCASPVNRAIEHAAEVSAGDGAAVHADADEATRELVHDQEHPVAPEHATPKVREMIRAIRGQPNRRLRVLSSTIA